MPSQDYSVLTQLNTFIKLDKFIKDSPELTFFRYQMMKSTNFALNQIVAPMRGTSTIRTCTIDRKGDLLGQCFMIVDMPGITNTATDAAWRADVGRAMIDSIQLEIGGQCIEQFSGLYMMAWDALSGGLKTLSGKSMIHIKPNDAASAHRLYVPLPFHFSSGNPGLSLPLVALPYHDIKVTVNLKDISQISTGTATQDIKIKQLASKTNTGNTSVVATPSKVLAWSDCYFSLETCQIYLDKEERASFADLTSEILIEQVQDRSMSAGDFGRPMCLTFNHAVSELIWCNQKADLTIGGQAYTGVSLTFNNHERFDKEHKDHLEYFEKVQPWMHHSSADPSDIYCYNFGLKPEDPQVSGSVSLSGIDNVMMTLSGGAGTNNTTHIFARCYNVLKIQDGMGGIMYTS
jgi:hypothetical protein